MLKNIKKIIVTGFVAVSALFSTAAFAETSPYTLMQQTADKLFGNIKANQSKIRSILNIYVLLCVMI